MHACLQGVQPPCREYVSALRNCLVRARKKSYPSVFIPGVCLSLLDRRADVVGTLVQPGQGDNVAQVCWGLGRALTNELAKNTHSLDRILDRLRNLLFFRRLEERLLAGTGAEGGQEATGDHEQSAAGRAHVLQSLQHVMNVSWGLVTLGFCDRAVASLLRTDAVRCLRAASRRTSADARQVACLWYVLGKTHVRDEALMGLLTGPGIGVDVSGRARGGVHHLRSALEACARLRWWDGGAFGRAVLLELTRISLASSALGSSASGGAGGINGGHRGVDSVDDLFASLQRGRNEKNSCHVELPTQARALCRDDMGGSVAFSIVNLALEESLATKKSLPQTELLRHGLPLLHLIFRHAPTVGPRCAASDGGMESALTRQGRQHSVRQCFRAFLALHILCRGQFPCHHPFWAQDHNLSSDASLMRQGSLGASTSLPWQKQLLTGLKEELGGASSAVGAAATGEVLFEHALAEERRDQADPEGKFGEISGVVGAREFLVDWYLPSLHLCVEIDGPGHFLDHVGAGVGSHGSAGPLHGATSPTSALMPNGGTVLKRAVARALGYRHVSLSFRDEKRFLGVPSPKEAAAIFMQMVREQNPTDSGVEDSGLS